ncbi:2-keto-4-pentenoate hydratase/2-oxohepta-3-ene-1,7-dioic acid hydratase (catechol pathway) [Noviherbaspirillum humi]|uniref:2-keto-4-pentenoate hydratase/2-oxohepta-3-ene-1,7-dioic acid hydratase (Catechol pathway) n=1 Tax=Noviherbaspirillum humi TaxID=1688639 RepID=A0A239F2I7_9BURK|nr:fumarylacetoacetate hydrolase family protein [Noviherbaspirillum humi]SNS50382.1 2-keto-4-pentenoate hydratase/2-oxohepta-3-ene-1,7-dioic acid hydratase (catechol pathway) [Noviherbaspirillum humi]
MKYQLFTYAARQGQAATGIAVQGRLYDLTGVAGEGAATLRHASIDALLKDWERARAALAPLAERLADAPARRGEHELAAEGLRLLPPFAEPGVIYAAGANYRDHVEAMGRAMNMKLVLDPKAAGIPPWHFIKAGRGTLAGHREHVPFPARTNMLDWEAELAVVIGRRASKVSVDEALDHVAGYTCSNDLSARDVFRRDQVDPASPFRFDWIGHKCFNGSCPIGPFLTPAEFVDSPENLGIKLWLNGELKQDSNTRNHLYGVADQIAYLSERIDLHPGDIILTGTPAGVGAESGNFLKRGDVMRVWIEGLGELETTVV